MREHLLFVITCTPTVFYQVDEGEGVRGVGTAVDVRPGYQDASTQTDPVKTVDMAV